jgi:hypothetical protein
MEEASLPHPIFLSTHFAIAEILHASGMGETIDQQVRDVEEIGCLRAKEGQILLVFSQVLIGGWL